MSRNNLPSGPTEQEVRQHYGELLPPDAKLMRPAYTSIWALEDGSLLWSWRNGFEGIGGKPKAEEPKSQLKTVVYLIGADSSYLVALMSNAVEANIDTVLSQLGGNLLNRIHENTHRETVVFTAHRFSPDTEKSLRLIAEELGLIYYTINLTHK